MPGFCMFFMHATQISQTHVDSTSIDSELQGIYSIDKSQDDVNVREIIVTSSGNCEFPDVDVHVGLTFHLLCTYGNDHDNRCPDIHCQDFLIVSYVQPAD